MISTVSFSFDLTYVNPQGVPTPRCVITDSTDYASLFIDLMQQEAKGYGVLTFNGEVIEAKNIPGNPLIDLEFGQTTAYIDLPVDMNGNVANGTYGFQYSLRLNSVTPTIFGTGSNNTLTLVPPQINAFGNYLVPGNIIETTPLLGGATVSNVVTSASVSGGSAVIGLQTALSPLPNTYVISFINVVNEQFNETYSYSGCTLATADVDFVYDCEYGDSGTWSVSNATALGSNEIVTSLSCTINYPSWTTSNPLFNPQVVTTVLPYPTYPSPTPPVTTPLATGTYTVSLSEQIQQTQSSGLVVIYNKSVIKEFTVSCAGTLCGLVPCIENLRAAHAAELIRNKVSKYQVYVDNVALYYLEAMNYKACGELDKYKSTIDLLQAQLDASGCDCACCDDESYYWVSNNSANSIIDELLANFQYRLYSGGGDSPGDTESGVEFGAIWQDVDTGIFYRCINDAPGGLQWEVYYDPSIFHPTGADNGLSISGDDVVLGGALDNDTTINLGLRNLTFTGTVGNIIVDVTSGSALEITGGVGAVQIEGTSSVLDVLATSNTAGILEVQRTIDDTVATNLILRTSVDGGPGVDGIGSSLVFSSEGAALVSTASIESVLVGAASPQQANLNFKTKSDSSNSLLDRFTLNPDGSATLHSYGDGNITGTPTYALGVDEDGKIIETNSIVGAINGLTEVSNNVELGGTLTKTTIINRGANDLTISGTTSSVSITGSDTSPSLSVVNSTNRAFSSQGVHGAGSGVFNTLDLAGSNTASPTLLLGGFSLSPGNGYGTSLRFSANEPTATFTGYMSSIISTWQNIVGLNSRLDITTASAGVESTQLSILANGDVYLDKYGKGNKSGGAAYNLGVASNGQIIESEIPAYSLIVLRVTQSSSSVTIQEIVNTTKNAVTGSNFGTGDFRLGHPSITAAKTSVLVQNGNIGPSSRIGFVYAEAGSGLINFKTYVPGISTPIDAVLNNAIVEIKIFP